MDFSGVLEGLVVVFPEPGDKGSRRQLPCVGDLKNENIHSQYLVICGGAASGFLTGRLLKQGWLT